MQDKLSQSLFNILYEFNPTTNYRVVTFDDIRTKWEGMTNMSQLVDELIDGGYIECKYRDEANICYICTRKPQIEDNRIVVDERGVPYKPQTQIKSAWPIVILSGISAFVGALLAVILGFLIFI